MHAMTFWWGDKVEDLVIRGLNAEDAFGLTLLCLGLIGLCLLYEGIKFQQARVRLITIQDRYKSIRCQPPNESATLLTPAELSQQRLHMAQQISAAAGPSTTSASVPPPRVVFHDPAPKQRLVQLAKEAFIFLLQGTLGYFLMLAVMSYNIPIFLTVVIGMALGYFLFGHFTMGLNMQSQTLSHTTFTCSTNCPNGESIPPAFATSTHSANTNMDENQNVPASALALKKLQSVAEGIVDHTNTTQMQQKGSCCNA